MGVFIKVWQPDFLQCHWEQERLDAMRVAAHLEIPFLTCDAEAAYKKDVADYFIGEYARGRTPNPDIMCNTHVKFGAFYHFAKERGATYVATGHYARTRVENGEPELYRGIDTDKDQSYFLWNIEREVLAETLFPVGGMTKTEVRQLAKDAELPTATKDESQGICFLGQVDVPEFLQHYLTLTTGPVVNAQGTIIGEHDGAALLTIGQRHGLRIMPEHAETGAYFVTAKNMKTNTITVSHTKPELKGVGSRLILSDAYVRLLSDTVHSVTLELQTRYRQKPVRAQLVEYSKGNLTIDLLEGSERPAPGQSCVLYYHNRVVGGGIIEDVQETT